MAIIYMFLSVHLIEDSRISSFSCSFSIEGTYVIAIAPTVIIIINGATFHPNCLKVFIRS